jgi:hypothetical protein
MLLGFNIEYNPQLRFKHFITTQRLNHVYLKKLFKGFAQAGIISNIYKDLINEKNMNVILYPIYKIFISLIRILYHQIHPQFKQKRKILIVYDKGIFIEYVKHFMSIKFYIQRIQQLKTCYRKNRE